MTHQKKFILATLFIVSLAIVAFIKYRQHGSAQDENAVWVEANTVKETSLPLEARAIGTLVARSVEITPEVAGHVENIFFQDGGFVKKDMPLIQLDDAVFKAKYESAKAKLAYSANNYNRMVLLGKHGAIAKQAIDQAEADLKENKAATEESEVMVNKMKLLAPFDGRVAKSKVNLGDYVTVGQSVVTLTDIKHLRIEYNVPEQFLPLLKLGQSVTILSATYPGKTFTGKVAFISPSINIENRSVSLYAEVPNEDNVLAPGMFVNVVQSLGKESRVLMIPSRSLVPILDGEQVFKVVEGKAYAVTVLTGKRAADNVQVVQGLAVGDVIITDGQLKVKNGMPVKIKS